MQNKDKLKIAVTGNSGSGKSSFINTFCGLSAKDDGAKVGVTSPDEIKSYPCHENDNIVLFEIPGVGSPKPLKPTSLEDIGFGEFDFFIIISSSRFTEDDVWLGEMAIKHRKKCFYVRTKIDFDIIKNRYEKGDAFNEAATLENVRQEARKCLSEANVDAPIYLITTRMRHSFDFTSLVHDVNGSAVELKENAQQVILQNLTENVSGNTTDVYEAISEKDQSLIKSVYREKGATGLKDVIMQKKDTWKSQPLKIAVTGNTRDEYDAISEKDQCLIKSVYIKKGAAGLKDVIMQNKDTWKSQPLKIAVTGNTTDVYDVISEKDQSLIKSVYKEKGAAGLKDVIMQNKDTWKTQPLKIAVTGNSGSGKSSFINAFCGLSKKDERAPVGVTETTKEIRSYTCTGNDKFVLFDLPGVGTDKFPKESYLEDIEFEKFHFFIIISSSRFTENDAWLGTTIRKHRKQCFFVRTKLATDIQNESSDQGDDFNEAKTIEKIRNDAQKCLKEANVNVPVYLISTRLEKEKTFEFSSLKDAVNASAMELKTTALRVRFQTLAESVIDEKIELLKKSVGRVAMASAIGGAVPLPGVSIGVDAAVILSRVNLYRRKLFLDENSLQGVHDTYSIKIDELELACRKIQFTEYSIPAVVTVNALGTLGKLVVPVLGSMTASCMCHDEMKMKLNNSLQDLKKDALKIIREITKQMI